MSTQVTSEMIYDEVRRANERLRLIEDVIEEVVVKGLPEVSVCKGKIQGNRTFNSRDEEGKLHYTRGTQERAALNTKWWLIGEFKNFKAP